MERTSEAPWSLKIMTRGLRITALVAGVLILSKCAAFDSGVEWRDGSYALVWIDTFGNMSLCYGADDHSWGTLVAESVFSVGADKRYIVAQQHPAGRKETTNYFIIDKSQAPFSKDFKAVMGPMSSQEFAQRSAVMTLPPFSRTVDALK